jgi:glycosyltransferase involved in cell wall biosynthesis
MADLTVVESPGAAVNLALLLKHWGAAADIETVRFIPNPVPSSSVWSAPSSSRDKVIIAVGRWDDSVKGADLLRRTIAKTLDVRRDYRFVIVGTAAERVCAALRDEHRARVTCVGELAYAATQEALAAARILLVPSLLESFSFVTAEALCAGASVVVTPIESLVYLAGGGAYGSIARSFTSDALTAALLREIAVWDSGGRDVDAIAARWRSELGMAAVCDRWERVLAPVDSVRESGR